MGCRDARSTARVRSVCEDAPGVSEGARLLRRLPGLRPVLQACGSVHIWCSLLTSACSF